MSLGAPEFHIIEFRDDTLKKISGVVVVDIEILWTGITISNTLKLFWVSFLPCLVQCFSQMAADATQLKVVPPQSFEKNLKGFSWLSGAANTYGSRLTHQSQKC